MANHNGQEQSQPLTGVPSVETSVSASAPSQPDSFQRFQQRVPLARHRPGYARVPSMPIGEERESQQDEAANRGNVQRPGATATGNGLGIALPSPLPEEDIVITQHAHAQKHDTSNYGMTSPGQATPGSAKPLLSPPSTGYLSGTTNYDSPYSGFDTTYKGVADPAKQSHTSFQSLQQPSIYANSEAGLLPTGSRYDAYLPEHQRQHATTIKGRRLTWLSITIFVLAVYSTAMSALFFVVGAKGPRYGRRIRTGGQLTISGATVLTTFFAKTIELSFVTVIVALLGQALARRAYDKKTQNGITLAEIGMRSWILQPGTMITHYEGVRYAGVTVLGGISLLSAILAMLYVTAANALVQPQLKFDNPPPQLMQGLVKASFANPQYIAQECETPVTTLIDTTDAGTTCMQLEHAATAYHNYYAYLSKWSAVAKAGNGTSDLRNRPQGVATLNDTTKVTGSWIEQEHSDMAKLKETHGHIIVNVTMAMPHAGVIGAARDSINSIMQPEDLDGQGVYRIHASVPSPVVYVTCAMLTQDYLKPVVASLSNHTLPDDLKVPQLNTSDPFRGGTSLDDIFQWGKAYGEYNWPPVFEKLPLGYNTIINNTNGLLTWGRDSVYLLGNSTIETTPGAFLSNPSVDTFVYPLCQIRVGLTPNCSTFYSASSNGAMLAARCEDDHDTLSYIKSVTNATSGIAAISRDWPNVAGELFNSIALNDGSVDGNGSNSRVLTQLVPKEAKFDPSLPSIAEALAVMAGSTLLQSTKDAPFVQDYNYSTTILDPGQYQYFKASIQAQQYASGGTAPYQRAFLVILFAVFILNLGALIYFVTHRDWYADVSEPSNLFSLAINSPPSKELAGIGGRGPQGKQFGSLWKLHEDGGHVYMESTEKATGSESPGARRLKRLSTGFDIMMSPVRRTTGKFGGGTVS